MGAIPRIPDERGRAVAGMLARDAYERWLANEATAILGDAFTDIAAQLRAGDLSLRDRQRLAARLLSFDQRLAMAYGRASQLTDQALSGLSQVEHAAAAAELRARVRDAGGSDAVIADIETPVLSIERLREITRFPVEGLQLDEWWQTQANEMSTSTRRTIQLGLVKGEGTEDIVRRIIPPRSSTEPAVWRRARSQARTVIRTATTSINARSSLACFESIGDNVTGAYELITARDARVSRICAAKDGLVFAYDDPDREIPPFHMSCRTVCIPVLNYAGLGLKPPGKRSPLTIQSFDGWLRGQPKPVQNDVLGATRGDWYRAGKMSLRQLIDEDDRVLTIEQLAARLGVDPPPGIARTRRAS